MKNIFLTLIAAIVLIACDPNEQKLFNGENGMAFAEGNSSLIIPDTGIISGTATIEITTLSGTDRTYNVEVVMADTDLPIANYTIGTLTIPANSYNGSLSVDFNDAMLADFVTYALKLKLIVPPGISLAKTDGDIFVFNIAKKVICNDVELALNFDFWASETTWEVRDDTGTVVMNGGPYTNGATPITVPFTLADGCYTFEMFDTYADGMYASPTDIGSYSLTCAGVIVHVTGGGAFGSSEVSTFCVNP